jgi:outer membrane protein W
MRKYLLPILFSAFYLNVSAQVVSLKVGPSISQMKWEISLSSDTFFDENHVGLYATLGLDYLQIKGFSLSSNIGYYSNGGNATYRYSDVMGNIKDTTQMIQLKFFTLNTIAKYNFMAEKKVSPFIGLGVGLNYLISYEENILFLKHFDETNKLNNLLWGLIGTAGLHVNLNKIRAGVAFMHNYNLNKLVNYRGNLDVLNQVSVNYFSVLFSVGYRLK